MKILEENGLRVAVLEDDHDVLRDELAVLDLIGELVCNQNVSHLVIPENALSPAFFNLKSGVAGTILQKFVNYQMRVAIVGDFSKYASKSLHQFIAESNRVGQMCFSPTNEDALRRLCA